MRIAVLLHNVRSSHNVGSIFRTSDATGVSRIYLSGYSPRPTDRFGRPQHDIAKTALGAEVTIPWDYVKNPVTCIKALKKDGWRIVGIEQNVRSRSFRNFKAKNKTLFVFGNEVRGISKALLNACDELLEIPMKGKKESLNVSVCAGVILFSAIQ